MWGSSQSTALGLDGSDKNQWDQLVNGLRWYRWNTIDKRRFYVFRIESPEQVRSVGVDPRRHRRVRQRKLRRLARSRMVDQHQ